MAFYIDAELKERRYVDVDLAIDEIIKDMCGVPDIDEGLSTAISELRLMPTADVVEVVHGEWIIDDASIEHCSVCKHRFYISALFAVGGNDEPPCCPNCGARMKGVDDGCNY